VNRSGIILLVDDSPDDVALALRAFQKQKIVNEIVIAHDGEEALDYLFARGVHSERDLTVMPDVVLLDLKLPKIDGLGVLHRVRADQRTRSIPVVILTSSDEARDVIASYDLGANSFVRKPINFLQFVEAARQLGQYWLVHNELAQGR
jgi:two-component system response regulator